jgi:hypothetical protein
VDDLNGFCEAVEGSGVSQLRKGCWQIRKMFMSDDHDGAAPGEDGGHAAVDLDAHHVTAAGEQHQRHQGERDAEDSTTWLSTSASVGFIPAAVPQPAAPSARSPPALAPGHPSAPASAFASASTPVTAVTKHSNIPATPESRIPPSLCRSPADTTPRQNSTHKTSDYLPGQSSSTPADAFFYTPDRVGNEKN